MARANRRAKGIIDRAGESAAGGATYRILLPDGSEVIVRRPAPDELRRLTAEAAGWASAQSAAPGLGVKAYLLAALATSPAMTPADALRMATDAPALFRAVVDGASAALAVGPVRDPGGYIERRLKALGGDVYERLRLQAARDVWGRHPDELDGLPYSQSMLLDYMALKLWEVQNEPRLFG